MSNYELCEANFQLLIFESAPKTPKTDFAGLQLVENQ